MTANHVLLHTFERIHLATDGCLVEHLGGLLEGSRRHEALRLQGGTCDTLEYLRGCGGHHVAHLDESEVAAAQRRVLVAQLTRTDDLVFAHRFGVARVDDVFLAPDTVVLVGEVEFVDNLLLEERGVARFDDLHLAHHLAYDDLEMLVVDLHTLQTVHILYLVDDILLYRRGALDGQDVARRDGAVGER